MSVVVISGESFNVCTAMFLVVKNSGVTCTWYISVEERSQAGGFHLNKREILALVLYVCIWPQR